MDIRIDNEFGKFKFRVCGILQQGDKYLTVKINNNGFYCLPGGHVELDEDTDSAVLREMQEELGYPIKIKRLITVNQNFFKTAKGKPFHEIGFYYICEAVNKEDVCSNDYVREELDKGELKTLAFKWFTQEELKHVDFKPTFVADCLNNETPIINITRD